MRAFISLLSTLLTGCFALAVDCPLHKYGVVTPSGTGQQIEGVWWDEFHCTGDGEHRFLVRNGQISPKKENTTTLQTGGFSLSPLPQFEPVNPNDYAAPTVEEVLRANEERQKHAAELKAHRERDLRQAEEARQARIARKVAEARARIQSHDYFVTELPTSTPPIRCQDLIEKARANDLPAQVALFELVWMRRDPEAIKVLDEFAFAGWLKAAKAGDANGQYLVASCHALGVKIATDPKQALTWMRKAADQGLAIAQARTAVFFRDAVGTKPNSKRAYAYASQSAAQANPRGEEVLGALYFQGVGVPQDLALGARWFERAAIHGDAKAQSDLAMCYFSGEGVPELLFTAVAWWNRAALQHDEESIGWLERLGVTTAAAH